MHQVLLSVCLAACVLPSACDEVALSKETRKSLRQPKVKLGSCAEYTCEDTYVNWRPCQCNSLCKDYGNCCTDFQAVCVALPAPVQVPAQTPPPAEAPALPDASAPVAPVAPAPEIPEVPPPPAVAQPAPVAQPPVAQPALPDASGPAAPAPEAIPPPPAVAQPAQPAVAQPTLPHASVPVAPAPEAPAPIMEPAPPAPANVHAVNVTALPWTWKDASLNSPSSAPLYTFYMYRSVSDEVYPPLNTNMGSLAGVLWYLHHEVVIQAPRKFQITRILRYKVQVRATAPLVRLGMHFGVRLAYDKGQATGPFVCGRTNITAKDGTTAGLEPKFCGNGDAFDKVYLEDLKPYKDAYEYAAFGYNVGCNNLGSYPFPVDPVYYSNAIWYTMPGACPNNLYHNKDNTCQSIQPGGYCPGVEPNGNGTCTWNYEEAGEISVDEMVGIKDYASWSRDHREYDPETDEGIKFSWWNGINSTSANAERVRQASELFDKRYPHMPSVEELQNPPCDFDFGYFYKEWYRKDGYKGACGYPNAACKGGIAWMRYTGLAQNPKWYTPLTPSASDDDIQRLLYQLGKNECLRPCERGETPTQTSQTSLP